MYMSDRYHRIAAKLFDSLFNGTQQLDKRNIVMVDPTDPPEVIQRQVEINIRKMVGTWREEFHQTFDAAVREAAQEAMATGYGATLTGYSYKGVAVTAVQYEAFMRAAGFEHEEPPV